VQQWRLVVTRPYPGHVRGSLVDLILLALIVLFGINGYRQGFVVGALSFVGFFGGALIGLQLAPLIVEGMSDPLVKVLVSVGLVFGIALLGQTLAAWSGTKLRLSIKTPSARRADDVGGVFVSILALLLVAWMVAGPLASSQFSGLSRSVRNSAILGAVNAVMPNGARVLYQALRDSIAQGGFPNVFGDLTPSSTTNVPAPDPRLANSAVVRRAAGSVVKITGNAPSCRRRIEGSGFVISAHHVMTNAHVVAGTEGNLQVAVSGQAFSGRVVWYDPEVDLAVVYVPSLDAPALSWADSVASTGDDAIVLGYPLNGPFTPTAARIRDRRDVTGPDIYEDHTVVREVYTIRALVRSGNSGGPLLDAQGGLLGVVFAAALDDDQTGFVLTAREAEPIAAAAADRTAAVDTENCA
jgi:S1-C subfamily serine protease